MANGGQKNQGWMVAITNMMFDHDSRRAYHMMVEVKQLTELAKRWAQRMSSLGR
jgi:hypothetical protein